MRHRVLTGLIVLLVLPALVWGQSLSELAKEEKESHPATDIPADASLEQKLSLLESMKASYLNDVKAIDEEIQKNNRRLAEIQDALVSTGGTGLPTAPQADRIGDWPDKSRDHRHEPGGRLALLGTRANQKKTLKD